MENFYYASLYDVLQNPIHRTSRTEKLNRLKAQLIKLYRERAAAGTIEMQCMGSYQDESITLFHIIRQRKRRDITTIAQVTESNGRSQTSPTAILETFAAHYEQKFLRIDVDDVCVKSMAEAGYRRTSEE
jgi:type II secretory pathway component PulJ